MSQDATGSEALAEAALAYGGGEFEQAIAILERSHARLAAQGASVAAAEAAGWLALYLLMDTGLMAPVRGWLARARRQLEDQPQSAAHALVAMVAMYERFLSGDMPAAGDLASQAVTLGTEHGLPPAVAMGRVCAARVRIHQGAIDEGLAQLDEIAATLLSHELDSLTVGIVWCELVCAVRGLAQYERASEWTEAMGRWGDQHAIGSIRGRCRVHRAEVLRLHGDCDSAEDEALHACDELRPWLAREYGWPLTELGTIRLRRGDFEGAEQALVEAHGHGWDPHPALALLRLAQGRGDEALALVDGALRHPVAAPSKEQPPNNELRRAPLLEAQVRIAVAAGARPVAAAAAEELGDIAERFPSRALRAMAATSRARVALASDAPAAAAAHVDEALRDWLEVQAPWETADARMVLGRALRAAGNDAGAVLEFGAARDTFQRLGAPWWAQQAADECTAAPASPARPASSTGTCVFHRDGDTRTITFADSTVLLQDLKGMRHLARLLAEPGREFHVVDLDTLEQGGDPRQADRGDAGPLLDEVARDAYRRRLTEVEQDIEEATAMHDPVRAEHAAADRDFLLRELSLAVGLGGRSRAGANASERARFRVTRAVRYAMERIAEHHPALADHLRVTVRTGTWCAYEPDPRAPVSWHC